MAAPKTPRKSALARLGQSRLVRKATFLTALGFASQMGAAQQQERYQSATTPETDEKVLLEQDRRSYVEQTETEKERSRQQEILTTRQQFLAPGGEQPEQSSEQAPEPLQEAAPLPQRATSVAQTTTPQLLALQQAQAVQQVQQQDRQAAAQQRLAQGYNTVQDTRKLYRTVRQVGEAASGWGILLLIIELNVQTVATLFHMKNITDLPMVGEASNPKIAFTCCLNCGVCASPIVGLFPFFISILLAFVLAQSITSLAGYAWENGGFFLQIFVQLF